MRTEFSTDVLKNPDMQTMEGILRKCVHCGFCNSTCPTFQLTGDELDGPRGRIYLMKSLFENQSKPSDQVVEKLDRCLSCLSCMTTCPSGVNYMHLIDQGREYVEEKHTRSWINRLQRFFLLHLLPDVAKFRKLLVLAGIFSPLAKVLPPRFAAPLRLAKLSTSASNTEWKTFYPATGTARGSVALLMGCVQQSMDDEINQSSISVLNKQGFDVHILETDSCCGAIEHHLGASAMAKERAEKNARSWEDTLKNVDALINNASGCGTMLKDYDYLLRRENKPSAKTISAMTKDICEFLYEKGVNTRNLEKQSLKVTYQSPCSMQHGQGVEEQALSLLRQFGFSVTTLADAHICCGSAGTYNILQADLAEKLGRKKAENIQLTDAEVVASGNLGCMLQLRQYSHVPLIHTVQLLDWVSGGPEPRAIKNN